MFRFMQRFGRDSQARWRRTGSMTRVRRRNHRLNCEALEGRQLLSATPYYIVNEASGKVLDDPGGSTSNGAHIDQWQLNGGTNQRWDLVPVGNGNYAIENGPATWCSTTPDPPATGPSSISGSRTAAPTSNGNWSSADAKRLCDKQRV